MIVATPHRPTAVLGHPFQAVEIGEAVAVHLAYCPSAAELRACARALRAVEPSELSVIAHLPADLAVHELLGLLDSLTSLATRVVLVPHPANGLSSQVREVMARTNWLAQVQIEPSPRQAVVGTMQSLVEGDTLAILWPQGPDVASATSLVVLGSRWRGAWESSEDGEFTWLSAGPIAS